MFLVLIAGLLFWRKPASVGSGVSEINAYLNGVNLNSVVRMSVLVAKSLGTCFSCAAGLPLGREGPMIHASLELLYVREIPYHKALISLGMFFRIS
jgi:H+/Cl- antiporter ClcA